MTNDNDARGSLTGSPKTDSHEFIVTTNREHEEWFRAMFVPECEIDLKSLWAWQEQERRKRAALASLPAGDGLTDEQRELIVQATAALDFRRGPESIIEGLREMAHEAADNRVLDSYLNKREAAYDAWSLDERFDAGSPRTHFYAGWTARRNALAAPRQPGEMGAGVPKLKVFYGPMPESNGKSNFTAILYRDNGNDVLDIVDGVTLEVSEYPDRVRYEADRARFLIGEMAERPDIFAYDADKHSGYVEPAASAINPAYKANPIVMDSGTDSGLAASAQQDEREAWRQRAESMRNVAGDNALRVPPETMLALLAQQVQADAGAVAEAFYDGSSREPVLSWTYDGYKPAPNDVLLYTRPAAESDKREIERLTAIADEYDACIRHMDAGGDFYDFQSKRSAMSREQSGGQ